MRPHPIQRSRIVVIGAGIAGLATALRLSAAGLEVTLLERHATLGGKIRTHPSSAGPIDAGPTVLTMRHVFDGLFESAGEKLEDHVTLIRQDLLARHFWPDGSRLDLFEDEAQSLDAVRAFAGAKAADQFLRFSSRSRRLFEAFDAPMMQAMTPRFAQLAGHVLRRPGLIPLMGPLSTLHNMLRRSFDDPRLVQLFGRYATYVGGSPSHAPAILQLIWHAEAAGVWVVKGGMHKLTEAIGRLLAVHGVRIITDAHVDRIEIQNGLASKVHLQGGDIIPCDGAVYAGDPRALATGALGPDLTQIARQTLTEKRSFSARVHSFAATPHGSQMVHHNVFFDSEPLSEFHDLMANRVPDKPSIYICALDRGQGVDPPALERFEIITNAPPTDDIPIREDIETWHPQIMQKIAQFGLTFSPMPSPQTVTTPRHFAQMFPESQGALYGQTPHGMTAGLKRPTARTAIPNLYLAGGGTHPGAGVSMATLSARHAAEAILSDLTSTSTSPRTAMHGGMSTA
ncbi:MAG: 1-hydroxycarotenoid 3,4-desaturase CrtD [Pseudomonadota bacterium]